MRDYTFSDNWITYVPEFDGNRLDDDPITVDIKPLTVREAQKTGGNVTAKRVKGGFRTDAADINLRTFVSHVRNIRNLSINGKVVTRPEELLETGLHELVGEIQEALTDASMLSEGDVKNLPSPSGGSNGKPAGTANPAPPASSGSGTAAASTGR